MEENKTWIVSSLPKGRTPIGCRFILKKKRDANGRVQKYKARLVAQGFSQKEGIDFSETFAPVTTFATITLLLNIATFYNYEMHQMDFDSAYLNAALTEEIYMKAPQEYEIDKNKVLKLEKSLYGLKQAGREWFKLLKSKLIADGWTQSLKDPCLFKKSQNEQIMVLVVYVDDVVIMGAKEEDVAAIKLKIGENFKVKDLGELHFILGVRITRERDSKRILIDQEALIKRTISKYLDFPCKVSKTPLAVNAKLTKYEGECDEASRRRYQAIVGSLLYISRYTRPDLSFAVGVVSKFAQNPGPEHFDAINRIIGYLKGTITTKVLLKGGETNILTVYCDADWASDQDERKSVSGYVIYLGRSIVTWGSKKQHCIALSTMEAELIALNEGVKEALWIASLLEEYQGKRPKIVVHCDNKATISIIEEKGTLSRAKHIDIRHHFLKDLTEKNEISIRYIESANNVADLFTKPLAKNKFNNFKQTLGLVTCPSSGSVELSDDEVQDQCYLEDMTICGLL